MKSKLSERKQNKLDREEKHAELRSMRKAIWSQAAVQGWEWQVVHWPSVVTLSCDPDFLPNIEKTIILQILTSAVGSKNYIFFFSLSLFIQLVKSRHNEEVLFLRTVTKSRCYFHVSLRGNFLSFKIYYLKIQFKYASAITIVLKNFATTNAIQLQGNILVLTACRSKRSM